MALNVLVHGDMPNDKVVPERLVPPPGLVHPSRVAPEKRAEAEAKLREFQAKVAAQRKAHMRQLGRGQLSAEDARFLAEIEKAKDPKTGTIHMEKLPEKDRERMDRQIADSLEDTRRRGEDPEVIGIVGKRPPGDIRRIAGTVNDVIEQAAFIGSFSMTGAISQVQGELVDLKLTDEQVKALLLAKMKANK